MKVLLLGPKHNRKGRPLVDVRIQLAECLAKAGHRAIILEREPDQDGETLRHKFLRLAGECDHAVLVWPASAAMATTADEIVLLQEACERREIEIVLILHETEAEPRGTELHVHSASDQSRYLDGILAFEPFIITWSKGDAFERPLENYADAFL